MTLLKAPSEIRANEFLFGDTDYLFHSKTFFDLNASNGDVFLELETGKNMISLPIDPLMNKADRVYIVEKVKEFFTMAA